MVFEGFSSSGRSRRKSSDRPHSREQESGASRTDKGEDDGEGMRVYRGQRRSTGQQTKAGTDGMVEDGLNIVDGVVADPVKFRALAGDATAPRAARSSPDAATSASSCAAVEDESAPYCIPSPFLADDCGYAASECSCGGAGGPSDAGFLDILTPATSASAKPSKNRRPRDPFLRFFAAASGRSRGAQPLNPEQIGVDGGGSKRNSAINIHSHHHHRDNSDSISGTEAPAASAPIPITARAPSTASGANATAMTPRIAVTPSPPQLVLPTPIVESPRAGSVSGTAGSVTFKDRTGESVMSSTFGPSRTTTPLVMDTATTLREAVAADSGSLGSTFGSTGSPLLSRGGSPQIVATRAANGVSPPTTTISAAATRAAGGRRTKNSSPSAGALLPGPPPVPAAVWVHAPAACQYHTELEQRCAAGQLMCSPYERLLTRCIAGVLQVTATAASPNAADMPPEQESGDTGLVLPSPPSVVAGGTAAAQLKALYSEWRAHSEVGEDIALAFNADNGDPYQGLVQHRASVEWRVEKLAHISQLTHEAFTAERRSWAAMESATAPISTTSPASPSANHSRHNRHRNPSPLSAANPQRRRSSCTTNSSDTHTMSAYSCVAQPSLPIAAMSARCTVAYWQRRVNLCQLFEDLFADTVRMLEQLPLFIPSGFGRTDAGVTTSATATPGADRVPAAASATMRSSLYHDYVRLQARLSFLRESPKQAWTAEKTHVSELVSALGACWEQHATLREWMRRPTDAKDRRSRCSRSSSKAGGGSLLLTTATTVTSEHRDWHTEPEETIAPSVTLDILELAGVEDVRAFVLSTLHSRENASAAATALHGLIEPLAEKRSGSAYNHTNTGSRSSSDGKLSEDEEWPEEELLTAQNLSPRDVTATQTHTWGETGVVAGASRSGPSQSSYGSSAGSLQSIGGSRKLKLVVASPLLVDGSGDGNEGVDTTHGTEAVSRATSPTKGRTSASPSPLLRPKRERHITFALEPVYFEDAAPVDAYRSPSGGTGGAHAGGDAGAGGDRSRGFYMGSVLSPSAPRYGKAATSATAALSLTTRQSQFLWKRYADEKDEVAPTLARRSALPHGKANPAVDAIQAVLPSLGAPATALTCATKSLDSLRLNKQRVLQLFLKLDEEDGMQQLQASRAALDHAEGLLRARLKEMDEAICARKQERRRGGSLTSAGGGEGCVEGGSTPRLGEVQYSKSNVQGVRCGTGNSCPVM